MAMIVVVVRELGVALSRKESQLISSTASLKGDTCFLLIPDYHQFLTIHKMGKTVVKKPKKSFTSLVRTAKSLKTTWEEKMKLKEQKQLVKRVDDEKRQAIKTAAEVS